MKIIRSTECFIDFLKRESLYIYNDNGSVFHEVLNIIHFNQSYYYKKKAKGIFIKKCNNYSALNFGGVYYEEHEIPFDKYINYHKINATDFLKTMT